MALSILHLTDIHAGPGEVRDEDLKDKVPEIKRKSMLDRLSTYLRELPSVPDYVIVSGDTTNRGNPEGMQAFHLWLNDRIDEHVLPNKSHILVVPGNHDVKWKVRETPGWHRERYQAFAEAFIYAFPHAYIPGHDPTLNAAKVKLDGKGPLGGIKASLDANGSPRLASSEPFILDFDRDLLIFGFNSTLSCGVYLENDPALSTPLATLRGLYKAPDPAAGLLKDIEDNYTNSLLVDAGHIGDGQLDYFENLMKRLKQKLGKSGFANLTKIAVLHHHVGHLWRQQLEVKRFESVVDAADLKQALITYGFQFVLHGHKHMNHVGLDGTIIPIGDNPALTPLCIVSGGTISGHPRTGDKQTFKVLNFTEERGPRYNATIAEVPLFQDAAPKSVMLNEARHYQVTLARPVAEVHDFKRVKEQLDDVVRTKCAPELEPGKWSVSWGDSATLPPGDPELVGPQTSYRLNRIVETKAERLFFDVILATSRLRFRQRARVYWLLTDVKNLPVPPDGLKNKVILLIGNLGGTPLAQTTNPQEVDKSITTLREWFAPAINADWLDVRSHQFTAEEIAEIVATDSNTG
jgi:3',5'-cyclic AMP phosphodiesterase CpdA